MLGLKFKVQVVIRSYKHEGREAGLDEAGRGCLAGPVVAAAVVLPANCPLSGLDDSKKCSPKRREALRIEIEESADFFSVAFITPAEIDEINILNASIRAMHQALDKLGRQPDYLIVDGNRFQPYRGLPHSCIVRGDGQYASIAAASILAKTYRDEYMVQLHQQHPEYDWIHNKGYPTEKHRKALARYGPTPYHRKTFRYKAVQTEFKL